MTGKKRAGLMRDAAKSKATGSQATVPTAPRREMFATVRAVEPAQPVTDVLAKLEELRRQTQEQLDRTSDESLRGTLNDLLDAVSDATAKLNLQVIVDHTISLQAAADELDPGMEALERLQSELAAVARKIAAVARIVDTIDGVLSGVQGVLATFA